ncbi:MAG TPA: hypothetical protein VHZ55_02575 [Bryobacteraceae bacterium]|jgi:hypothetical protein|nr:hypothetical protein [Bryobacteraceae bacterium]
MDRTLLNEIPESGKPQFPYQIEVLALALAILGSVSLYSIALWALSNEVGLTQSFPWSDGPLSNWMIWLGLAMTLNAVVANTYPTRTQTERQKALLSRFIHRCSGNKKQQTAAQLALGDE